MELAESKDGGRVYAEFFASTGFQNKLKFEIDRYFLEENDYLELQSIRL